MCQLQRKAHEFGSHEMMEKEEDGEENPRTSLLSLHESAATAFLSSPFRHFICHSCPSHWNEKIVVVKRTQNNEIM